MVKYIYVDPPPPEIEGFKKDLVKNLKNQSCYKLAEMAIKLVNNFLWDTKKSWSNKK